MGKLLTEGEILIVHSNYEGFSKTEGVYKVLKQFHTQAAQEWFEKDELPTIKMPEFSCLEHREEWLIYTFIIFLKKYGFITPRFYQEWNIQF